MLFCLSVLQSFKASCITVTQKWSNARCQVVQLCLCVKQNCSKECNRSLRLCSVECLTCLAIELMCALDACLVPLYASNTLRQNKSSGGYKILNFLTSPDFLHPAHRRLQPLPSSVVVILASDIHSCPLSVIVHFRWLEATSGTFCRLTSPQLQRWLFFGTASKLNLFSQSFPNWLFSISSSVHRV